MKCKKIRTKAHRAMADDRIKIAGTMYQITYVTTGYRGDRIHIMAVPLGGVALYERISLFLPPSQKITIYNQK